MAARSKPGTATSERTSTARTRSCAAVTGTVSAFRACTRSSMRRTTSSTSARSRKPRMRTSKNSGRPAGMVGGLVGTNALGGNVGRISNPAYGLATSRNEETALGGGQVQMHGGQIGDEDLRLGQREDRRYP